MEIRYSRKFSMPNKWTFKMGPVKKLLDFYVDQTKVWIDPFAGENSPAQIKNDLNGKHEFCMDALEFLRHQKSDSVDGILLDPPYSLTQAAEHYQGRGIKPSNMKYWSEIKNQMARIIKPNGMAICFGWNSMGIGKSRGFDLKEIMLVTHGGSRNDTICTVESKIAITGER